MENVHKIKAWKGKAVSVTARCPIPETVYSLFHLYEEGEHEIKESQ